MPGSSVGKALRLRVLGLLLHLGLKGLRLHGLVLRASGTVQAERGVEGSWFRFTDTVLRGWSLYLGVRGTLNYQNLLFCRVPKKSILGSIIRPYKKVGYGSSR